MVEALWCRSLPASPETTVAHPSEPAGAWAAGRPPAGTVSRKVSAGTGHRWFHQPPSQLVAPRFLPGCDLLQSTRGWIPGCGQLGDRTGTGPRETSPDAHALVLRARPEGGRRASGAVTSLRAVTALNTDVLGHRLHSSHSSWFLGTQVAHRPFPTWRHPGACLHAHPPHSSGHLPGAAPADPWCRRLLASEAS